MSADTTPGNTPRKPVFVCEYIKSEENLDVRCLTFSSSLFKKHFVEG